MTLTYYVLKNSFNIESDDVQEQISNLKKIKDKMEKIQNDRNENQTVGLAEERSSS